MSIHGHRIPKMFSPANSVAGIVRPFSAINLDSLAAVAQVLFQAFSVKHGGLVVSIPLPYQRDDGWSALGDPATNQLPDWFAHGLLKAVLF